MCKLVVLKLEGTLEQGLQVRLEIGEDNQRPSTEIGGKLPKSLDLPEIYNHWQIQYRSQDRNFRKLSAKVEQVTHISHKMSRRETVTNLKKGINAWLNSEEFRSVKEKLLQKLGDSEEVRVLIQTEDTRLQQVPWHLWDFFNEYPQAELALSASEYEQVEQNISAREPKEKVKILAILGNSEGINVALDRQLLEALKNADVTFLIEPQRKDLNDKLWEKDWDILFFAGHSKTEGNKGRIFINRIESLNIEELKFALRRAIKNGLQLAIFNSCDGLGLARELSKLYIPQMIVMREPVPDRVAQEFLKNFLAIFSSDRPLYISVREAREKLQGMESEFPCATFLPVIFQNPAITPPTWSQLCHRPDREPIELLEKEVLNSRATVTTNSKRSTEFKHSNPSDLLPRDRPSFSWGGIFKIFRFGIGKVEPAESSTVSRSPNHKYSGLSQKFGQEAKRRNNREELDLYNNFEGSAQVIDDEPITPGKIGWVRFRGSFWCAQNSSALTLYPGDKAIAIGRKNLTLIVDCIDPSQSNS